MKVKNTWIITNGMQVFQHCIYNIAKVYETESGDYYAEYMIWGPGGTVSTTMHIEKISKEKAEDITTLF